MAVPISQIPTSVLVGWAELASEPVVTRGWGIVVLCTVLGAVCIAVVGSRLWLRAVVQRKPDISDWFTLIALILTLGFLVLACLTVKTYGLDHHVYNLSFAQLTTLSKAVYAAVFLTHWAEGFIRMSILLFYRLLLRNHSSKIFSITLWIVFAIILATLISSLVAMFFACTPLSAFWLMYNPTWYAHNSYHCTNHGAFLIATSAINAVLDLTISLMPMAVLWRLQMPIRQKIAIWALFSMGIFASAAAMLRIYWCHVAFYETYDFTWAAYGILLWTCIECTIALIGSSLPALKVVFLRIMENQKHSNEARDRGPTPYNQIAMPSSNSRPLPAWLRRIGDNKSSKGTSEDSKYGTSSNKSDVPVGQMGLGNRDWVISKSVTISTEVENLSNSGRPTTEWTEKDRFGSPL